MSELPITPSPPESPPSPGIVVLGRFQPFHRGHESLLIAAEEWRRENADNHSLIIAIGSSNREESLQNPWSSDERSAMIEVWLSESGIQDAEIVSIPAGSGAPGCEETNKCYIPSILTIPTGTTVIWENNDNAAHLATSGTPSDGPDGTFDSGMIMAGESFEQQFSDKGEFNYYCIVHPWMVGTVTIE